MAAKIDFSGLKGGEFGEKIKAYSEKTIEDRRAGLVAKINDWMKNRYVAGAWEVVTEKGQKRSRAKLARLVRGKRQCVLSYGTSSLKLDGKNTAYFTENNDEAEDKFWGYVIKNINSGAYDDQIESIRKAGEGKIEAARAARG
jgi:hypothetical protein